MAPLAEQKGLALTCDFADAIPPRVVGDGLRLRQIVLNLLGNAVKFTAAGESVFRIGRLELQSSENLAPPAPGRMGHPSCSRGR